MASDGVGVQVVVRLRPLNSKEKRANTLPVVTASTQRNEVTLVKGIGAKAMKHSFCFDKVFNEFTSQQEVRTHI
jgi:kinesin family protein 11